MDKNLGDLFVGYEAGPRLAELNQSYPNLFEREPDGKYIKRKINKGAFHDWFNALSKDLKGVVAKELNYYPYGPAE